METYSWVRTMLCMSKAKDKTKGELKAKEKRLQRNLSNSIKMTCQLNRTRKGEPKSLIQLERKLRKLEVSNGQLNEKVKQSAAGSKEQVAANQVLAQQMVAQ